MRRLALLLLFEAGCVDFERLFPTDDLGARDQSAAPVDQRTAPDLDVEVDAASPVTCPAHAHDGVWKSLSSGPGSSALGSLWASSSAPTLVAAYQGSLTRSTDDGVTWGDSVVSPSPTATAAWAREPDDIFYLNSGDGNGKLYEVDMRSSAADLSSGTGLVRTLTPSTTDGEKSLIVGKPGTTSILLGGLATSGQGGETALWDGTALETSATPFSVASIWASDTAFYRAGYRHAASSLDGTSWTSIIDANNPTLPMQVAIAARMGTMPQQISAGVKVIWGGSLATGETLVVLTLTPSDLGGSQLVCWQRGTDDPRCQTMPFVGRAIWGTRCGVVLIVGDHFSAMRYDVVNDVFELETAAPPWIDDTDSFMQVVGHDDGHAIVVTDKGALYTRD